MDRAGLSDALSTIGPEAGIPAAVEIVSSGEGACANGDYGI